MKPVSHYIGLATRWIKQTLIKENTSVKKSEIAKEDLPSTGNHSGGFKRRHYNSLGQSHAQRKKRKRLIRLQVQARNLSHA